MDFEKLGLFYLGRRYDPAARQRLAEPVLYDASDLVTHAVCIGMTGSGKTGLGVSLIEEAAIDGIPVLAIDPKGDLGNLMLTFPDLAPASFAPWVHPDDARAAGLSTDAFAAREAERWTKGLAEWGQDGARIGRLRAAADVTIYTPGSRAGVPLSILDSFRVPPAAIRDEPELLAERVQTSVTSLLTLAGVSAAPAQSREHILLSALLHDAWQAGRDLDLAQLIAAVQTPPMTKVGVLDLESFYPAADRFTLALQLNHLLAAPGFATWMEGAPLDIDRLLYTAEGRPRVAVISIAHLDEAQRMFFVSLLLGQVISWMRAQRGTSSLRALVYMDELFGYLPPTANPPSKTPLLTLLKQARAYGVGLVLATQNPVDLDYKALSNAGTWFLGRLQTERDKARVLDGLEGVASSAGSGFDRGSLDRLLSGLDKRVFLLHNVHAKAPEIFQTRWALSYLRGPLSRDEIRRLTDAAPATPAAAPAAVAPAASPSAASPAGPTSDAAAGRPPVLPPAIPQFFAPGGASARVPYVLGAARVRFADRKHGVDETTDVCVIASIDEGPVAVDWARATPAPFALA
ncbi:MAG: ATP-binding protein, partial [Vicinamibacteria bacterium]